MAGIALLLPDDSMMDLANKIVGEKENHVILAKKTTKETVVSEARDAIARGANIVVARGHQALEVKNYTKVPVVEIGITAQELGLTVMRAKKLLKKDHPVIGIFTWEGMLCDTEYFEELFDVKILRYVLEDTRPWGEIVEDGLNEGVEIVISGEQCVMYAKQKGIPALLYRSTGESLRIALEHAENLYYMSELEKHNYAQFSTVLDSSFNGIIKVDTDGTVLLMNRVMAQILQIDEDAAVGMHICEILDGLDQEILGQVVRGEAESYSTFINASDQALVVVLEPIKVESEVVGVIISCNRMRRLKWADEDTLREQFLRGNVARGNLDDLSKRYPDLKNVADRAKLYAQSASPIMVTGPYSGEIDMICQGIHNYSLRKEGPYLLINLDGMREEDQMRILFGEEDAWQGSAFSRAQQGTLVIYHIEKLALSVQYRLLRVITRRQLASYGDSEVMQLVDVRVIAYSPLSIQTCLAEGYLRPDLYYIFATFCLEVSPLHERKRDVALLLDKYLDSYLRMYSHYHVLTDGARKALLDYPWEGQETQLKAFCECMVLTVGKRVISEDFVRSLLQTLYGEKDPEEAEEPSGSRETRQERERLRIEDALSRHNGNRAQAARELGVSTTTLWRRMKKYSIF